MKSLTSENFEKIQKVFGDFLCLLYAQHVKAEFTYLTYGSVTEADEFGLNVIRHWSR